MTRLLIFFVLITLLPHTLAADSNRHGKIRVAEKTEAWDGNFNEWVTIEEFWENYTMARDGLTWSMDSEYPPYKDVKEHDTFIVKLNKGICLMEFFHTRWRRANDVRRWDPAFNEYSGCARVFD